MFNKQWGLLLLVAIATAAILTVYFRTEVTEASVEGPPRAEVTNSSVATPPRAGVDWPPQLDQPYPDLELINHAGQSVRMSDFKGKVIVVEYIGMTCPACQASAERMRREHTGTSSHKEGLGRSRIISQAQPAACLWKMTESSSFRCCSTACPWGAPTPEDAKDWARHFQMDRPKNHLVLAGKEELLGQASYDMIPGFQLIDKQFVLRSDSTGHRPRHNLWRELLPLVPKLLKEADGMSINDAYRAIPHRQTTYQVSASSTSPKDAGSLNRLFGIVDRAVVARVETLSWLSSGGRQGKPLAHYQRTSDGLLRELEKLNPPERIVPAVNLIATALQEQRSYLREWDKATPQRQPFPYTLYKGGNLHSLVRSSSSKLIQAYNHLMQSFPTESSHNRQAFSTTFVHWTLSSSVKTFSTGYKTETYQKVVAAVALAASQSPVRIASIYCLDSKSCRIHASTASLQPQTHEYYCYNSKYTLDSPNQYPKLKHPRKYYCYSSKFDMLRHALFLRNRKSRPLPSKGKRSNPARTGKSSGVGKTVVYDLEKGKETIRVSTLLRILEALNIQIKLESPLMGLYREMNDEGS